MSIYLHGLSLKFYRGIGSERQRLAPFKNFNFFIGANNAGKSTVLNFISEHMGFQNSGFEPWRQRGLKELSPLEVYRGKVTGQVAMEIGIPFAKFYQASLRSVSSTNARAIYEADIKKICELYSENGTIWFSNAPPYAQEFQFSKKIETQQLEDSIGQLVWRNVWRAVTGQDGGSPHQHWIPETLTRFLSAQTFSLPKVKIIPAIRQVGPKGSDFSDFSGQGLINRLAEIQSPDHDKLHERAIFDKINLFLQTVTGREGARIEIPHNREHVLVHMDDKVLPLHSLGMGIHEVIMIAAFCTLSESEIVCIEEPEIHLHPLLQRKLVAYLKEYTNNQYFIATHSAAFIDTPGAAIFHVTNDGEQTRIRESILRSERFSICIDLGHKASDIIQSNAVIWVEGPSDRIYIRHWIAAMDPELIEGIHYSIMFYGGRLLSHLSADSNEIDEFIALRSLNQNLAIVIDSDKRHSRDPINDTKARLVSEFDSGTGIAWVTKGREIENYISHDVLQGAVQTLYASTYSKAGPGGQFDHALYFERTAPKSRRRGESTQASPDTLIESNVDKVRVARLVCETPADLDILDLRKRVTEIVQMIQRANN